MFQSRKEKFAYVKGLQKGMKGGLLYHKRKKKHVSRKRSGVSRPKKERKSTLDYYEVNGHLYRLDPFTEAFLDSFD